MWVVQPDLDEGGQQVMSVIHLDTILCAAHLIGVYGTFFLTSGAQTHRQPRSLSFILCKYICRSP